MSLQTTSKTPLDCAIEELNSCQALCTRLLRYPHFQKMGEVGIFAILQKAKSLNMDPMEALNGGLYFVQGKVEMQGQAMLSLIRQAGHSVSMDPKSTNTHVIMFGKRKDNSDTWRVEFGIDDAKRAGIFRGQWEKYPKTMCIWRCVSMLSRFLFSDVIKGCYVQGEISDAVPFDAKVPDFSEEIKEIEQIKPVISQEQATLLEALFLKCDVPFREKVMKYLSQHMKIDGFSQLPLELFERIETSLMTNIANNTPIEESVTNFEEDGQVIAAKEAF